MKKIVLLYSGGADSTLLLHLALKLGYTVICIGIDYAQTHKKELKYAKKNCTAKGIEFITVSIRAPFSSNLNKDKQTYEGVSPHHVPSRNLMFVSIAASIAESRGVDTIWLGANYEDRKNLFPDCYQEWVYSVNQLLQKNGSTEIKLEAPLLGMHKDTIQDYCKLLNINSTQIFSGYGTKK